MQSTSGTTPAVFGSAYTASSGIGLTPVLTPTTMANFERALWQQPISTFSDVNSGSGFFPPADQTTHSNQIPGMMQIKSEVDYDTDYSSIESEADYGSSIAKRAMYTTDKTVNFTHIDPNTYLVVNSRRPTGPRKIRKNEKLTHEEEIRRKQRRDRNKKAAAKCRQKRDDITNILIMETETLEQEKNGLENEIYNLQQQKEQFEFLLKSHQNTCRHTSLPTTAATTTAFQTADTQLPQITLIGIAENMTGNNVSSITRPNTLPDFNTVNSASVTASSLGGPIMTPSLCTASLGVPIMTPSTGMFGFDSMVLGHTDLTPYSMEPQMAQSCSWQLQAAHQQSMESSSSSNELLSPSVLMAL